jgi:hypothetical protein
MATAMIFGGVETASVLGVPIGTQRPNHHRSGRLVIVDLRSAPCCERDTAAASNTTAPPDQGLSCPSSAVSVARTLSASGTPSWVPRPKNCCQWPSAGPGSRAAVLAMAFKPIKSAPTRWRGQRTHIVALVRAGAKFVNGQLVKQPNEHDLPSEPKNLDPQVLTIAPRLPAAVEESILLSRWVHQLRITRTDAIIQLLQNRCRRHRPLIC